MTRLVKFLEDNLNSLFVNVISGVAIIAIAGIIGWVCLTTSKNSQDIAVLQAVIK